MVQISKVLIPKAADYLALNLRTQILTGSLPEGTLLPNERELSERASISRTSVREALRILEGEGLIAIRTGRKGGSEVIKPSSIGIEKSIDIFIKGQGIRMQAVSEVREAIEPHAARLAAQNRSNEDLQELKKAHANLKESGEDIPAFLKANLVWHLQVVKASHNELLIAFMTAISKSFYESTDVTDFNSIEIRKAVEIAHQRVITAIESANPESAFKRMSQHVSAYITSVEEIGKPNVNQMQTK